MANESDLRDSRNIEQDADVVILLYCEQYYKQSKELVEGMTK
ncbi:DnaB-like helicase C-terminal domain-containing protein [Ureibacillus sp. MALMAid1270]